MKKQMLLLAVAGLLQAGPSAAEEALVTGYHLRPASATVMSGGSVDLQLVYCSVENSEPAPAKSKPEEDELTPLVPDDELAPLVQPRPDDDLAPLPYLLCEGDKGDDLLHPLVSPSEVEWRVDGAGSVSGGSRSATYHAPASKPTPNKVTVAVTFKYPLESGGKTYSDAKQTLLSRITIFDEIKTYSGTFSKSDVTVNREYTTNVSGKIRWEFDEYYEMGKWREYTGRGTATLRVSRTGCGTAATFEGVPVEGRLKVYEDKRYEFLINLVSDSEQTRICRRPDLDKDLKWEETFSAGGDAVSSGDPCGTSEFYPQYSDMTRLSFERKGGCSNVVDQFRQEWSFQAIE